MADAAIAERRPGLVREWCGRLFAALVERLAAERVRHLLWLPVFFGAGIGVYFALTVEPPLWPGLVMASAGAVVSLAMRRHSVWCRAALALTVFAAGFALMRESGEGELSFPVPWATSPEASFVESAATYRRLLEGAGFAVEKERSRREFAIEFFRQMRARAAETGGPPPLGLQILMGASAPQKVANMIDNLERGLIAPTEIVSRAI